MAEQQQEGSFVPVEVGAELWSASESWKDDNTPHTRNYVVTAVRPKTLLVSGAVATAWQERDRRYERSPDTPENAASGAVARTPYGSLYRTELDAVRALVRKTEQAVDRAELRLEGDRALLESARELLAKLGGGAAVLVALALVALAAPAPASAAIGFTQRVSTPELSGRTVKMTGELARTTAARRVPVRVTFTLYRAPRAGAQGTRIRTITRTLRAGQTRISVNFAERRAAASRPWLWFGFIDYTVILPGRDRRFTGTGRSSWLPVR